MTSKRNWKIYKGKMHIWSIRLASWKSYVQFILEDKIGKLEELVMNNVEITEDTKDYLYGENQKNMRVMKKDLEAEIEDMNWIKEEVDDR